MADLGTRANLTVMHTDANGKQTTETYKFNPLKFTNPSEYHLVDFETAHQIDAFARATVTLSTDTYKDTDIKIYDRIYSYE